MPRLRPPPAKPEDETPVIETHVAPEGDIEIELPGDDVGPAEVDLAPKTEVKPEPAVEENALQKALEAQQRAEDLARTNARERDEALRHARDREQELETERGGREEAEYGSVLTAIAAEESSLAKAESDYAAFAQAGDWAQAASAQRIIGAASARLDRLNENKLNFDGRRETARTAPPAPPQRSAPLDFEQKITSMQVPDTAKSWLRSHPELVNDHSKNEQLGAIHNYLTKSKNIAGFSQAYFDALDTEFGFKKEPEPSPQPQRRSMPVSAPVSRDVPTASGVRASPTKITLTEEQRRIARTSFTDPAGKMTDADKEYLYAQNLRKLQNMRANGQYPQPERN